MIVDFQHHYIPEDFARKKGMYSEKVVFAKEGGIPRLTLHPRLYHMDTQLQEMDEAGVDISVLSCILGWEASLQDCRLINDRSAELQTKFPGRVVGLAHAPVLEGEQALQELDRAVRELGLRGVAITSQIQKVTLDSPQLYDFYSKVSSLDVPIFIHPATVPMGYDLILDYDLARILGREMDLALATTRIIAGGILERFPDLKFVIGHFGGGISAIKDRLIAKGYRFGTLKRPFEEYFDMLYFDMAGFEGGSVALQCGLFGIKPERLVFATDYPQDFTGVSTATGKGTGAIRDYIAAIKSLELTESIKEDMLGGTAARLLKLV